MGSALDTIHTLFKPEAPRGDVRSTLQNAAELIENGETASARGEISRLAKTHPTVVGDTRGIDAMSPRDLSEFVSNALHRALLPEGSKSVATRPSKELESLSLGVQRTSRLRADLVDPIEAAFGDSERFRLAAAISTKALTGSTKTEGDNSIDLKALAAKTWCQEESGPCRASSRSKRNDALGIKVVALTTHEDHVYAVKLVVKKHERTLADPAVRAPSGDVHVADYRKNCTIVLSVTNVDDGTNLLFQQQDMFRAAGGQEKTVADAIGQALYANRKEPQPDLGFLRCFGGDSEFLNALRTADLTSVAKEIARDLPKFLNEGSRGYAPSGWDYRTQSADAWAAGFRGGSR